MDWVVAHYCQCSGEPWNDELEDTLTFSRIFARFAYWKEFPPTHVLVRSIAAYLGAYKPERRADPRAHEDAIAQVKAAFPDGRIR